MEDPASPAAAKDKRPPEDEGNNSGAEEEEEREAAAFPAAGLLPKAETQVDAFLRRHPEYDGRGTVVAVFDTGTDPGAPGLLRCPDGRPKVVDVVDTTGSGDVDTSTVREAAPGGTVRGLTGRALSLPASWENPTGRWHLGAKAAYDLFPGKLVARLRKERRRDAARAAADLEGSLRQELAALADATETAERRRDLEARLEQLAAMEKAAEDPGPVFDCVVWHDGATWRAAVDAGERGDLSEAPALASYREEHRYGTFGEHDLMNYALNVYDEGRLLEVVVTAGSHGTHVAGIVGAYFEGQPELNGIAPGCQIVSVKIGDSRLGSMETGPGLVRALRACVRAGCDMVNMSYGEMTSMPNRGRFSDLAAELVTRHGVIFVSSAGNSGPALSTTGAPGSTTSGLIGVGAFVSSSMMDGSYSMRERVADTQFTWSSRGPTLDGALGVSVSACGGAIASVPNWTLQKSQLMNGTSMSSPAACGGIALVLSGLKALGVPYAPPSVRRAVENTARRVRGVEAFAQGNGLLQVDAAFERLVGERDAGDHDVGVEVSVSYRGAFHAPHRAQRGIYLREPHQVAAPTDASVTLRPTFYDALGDAAAADGDAPAAAADDAEAGESSAKNNRRRVEFEMRVELRATAPWISCGGHVLLPHGGRSFEVRVDPSRVQPLPGQGGGAFYGEVQGFDTARPGRGPVFRLPVTVCLPEPAQLPHLYRAFDLPFRSGTVHRRFFRVPAGATWVTAVLRGKDGIETAAGRRLVVHAHQLGCEWYGNKQQYVTVRSGEEAAVSFPVAVSGVERCVEIALAQYWSSLGECAADLDVQFHGLVPSASEVLLGPARPVARVEVASPLQIASLKPSGSLTRLLRPLRPASWSLRPAPDAGRNALFGGRRIYQLLLTYTFELGTKSAASVTPRVPALNGLLYESAYGAQLWTLLDSNRREVAAGDAWPSGVKLGKGKYTLRLQVHHDSPARLETLKDEQAVLDIALPSPVPLSAYRSRAGAEPGADHKGFARAVELQRGQTAAVYWAAPSLAKVDRSLKLARGDELAGTVTYGSGRGSLTGCGSRPGGFPVRVTVPPPPPAAKEKADPAPAPAVPPPPPPPKGLAVADAQVAMVRSLKGETRLLAFAGVFGALLREHPRHLPVLLLRLRVLDEHLASGPAAAAALGDDPDRAARTAAVVAAADAVADAVDAQAVAAHYGLQREHPDKAMSEARDALAEALHRKAEALLAMVEAAAAAPSTEGAEEEKGGSDDDKGKAAASKDDGDDGDEGAALEAALAASELMPPPPLGGEPDELLAAACTELRRWVDTSKDAKKYLALEHHRDVSAGRLGAALARLNKMLGNGTSPSGEAPDKKLYVRRVELLERMGWGAVAAAHRQWMLRLFPAKDSPLS